jgi:hypothetical protein
VDRQRQVPHSPFFEPECAVGVHSSPTSGVMKSDLGAKWLEAGRDLGIHVTAPFAVTSMGQSISFDALVHDFGSARGMLLMQQWDQRKADIASELGYGFSCLSADDLYDRETTIEVLKDWGWAGRGPKPSWA